MHIDNKSPLIGVSPVIERVRQLIEQVSASGLNIVISGESGVGKEVVAGHLYVNSPRKGKPFIKINCAALPENLLESELFGYARGAFTGAVKRRHGKFKLADKGVLMLDEIGDLPLNLQAKLLQVLQNGEFSPLGSEKTVHCDVWIIAATNQKLESKIDQELFREDLYYRLSIIKIDVPPLRDRPEDIPLLVDHFIERYNRRAGREKIIKPSQACLEKMKAYQWPGNVRELQNAIKRYQVIRNWEEVVDRLFGGKPSNGASADTRSAEQRAFLFDGAGGLTEEQFANNSFSLKAINRKVSDKVEREIIAYVLSQTEWNRTKAVDILQISHKTLLTKIADLNIKPPEDVSSLNNTSNNRANRK